MTTTKELRPNPRNPRKITDEKLKSLKNALEEFGDLSGIVRNKRTNQLISGHQRVKVLPPESKVVITEVLGEKTKIGTTARGVITIGEENYSYREVDWDETKEKAANIAANKHGGEFDSAMLADWILELDAANYDMELTGFDLEELEDIIAPLDHMKSNEEEEEGDGMVECPKCGERFKK